MTDEERARILRQLTGPRSVGNAPLEVEAEAEPVERELDTEFRFKRVGDAWCVSAWDAPDAESGDIVTITTRGGEIKQVRLGDLVSEDRRLRIFKIARDVKPDDRLESDVPAGRYALMAGQDSAVTFYKVDRPSEGRWTGYVFVKQLVASGGHGLAALGQLRLNKSRQRAVLDAIAAAGIEESSALFGKAIGHCGVCGRELTKDESIKRGIGPVCAEKMGW